jgi:hypothetical protein
MAIKLVIMIMALFIGKISIETAVAEKLPDQSTHAMASIDESYKNFRR